MMLDKMLSCLCLFKNIPSWVLLLALLLPFSSYQLIIGFGFFSVLCPAIVVIFLSTGVLLYSVPKHRALQHVDKLVEEKVLISSEGSDQRENNIAPTTPLELEVNVDVTVPSNYSTSPPPDLLSESECQDQLWSSEDSEVDYHFPDFSDGSISDEESLIEISLPSGHYVDHDHQKDHESNYNYCSLQQQKKRELSAEDLFNQQSLMEFFSEFNEVIEEENFIEIDISMGSIKYSRFGIKA